MSYFQFNDYDSSEDLIITKPIIRPTWGRTVNEVQLPGNTRSAMQMFKCYENAEFKISAVIADATPENVHRIYAALNGFGKMLISTAPNEELDVWIRPITPEPVALLMAEIELDVVARPFATALSPKSFTIGSERTEVNNEGTVYAEPIIKLTAATGEVKINVNGDDFIINVPAEASGKEITVDCDAQVTYYGDKVSINQHTYGDYPLLHTEKNYVSTSSGTATLEMRERWL